MVWTPPAAPTFDGTYTYLTGTSSEMDINGFFTLNLTVVAQQIIGIMDSAPTYDINGYQFAQVNVIVPGLTLGFIGADYQTLLQEWQQVATAYLHAPSSTPADITGLVGAMEALEKLEPPNDNG